MLAPLPAARSAMAAGLASACNFIIFSPPPRYLLAFTFFARRSIFIFELHMPLLMISFAKITAAAFTYAKLSISMPHRKFRYGIAFFDIDWQLAAYIFQAFSIGLAHCRDFFTSLLYAHQIYQGLIIDHLLFIYDIFCALFSFFFLFHFCRAHFTGVMLFRHLFIIMVIAVLMIIYLFFIIYSLPYKIYYCFILICH